LSEKYYQNYDESTQYKDKVDIETIFMRQLERCLMMVGTSYFTEAVKVLHILLPSQSYYKLLGQEDRWKITQKALKYKYARGVKIGSPNAPVVFNKEKPVRRFKDGSVDWTDPNIFSPVLIEETIEDYHQLFCMICEEAYDIGLLWSLDQVTKVDYVKSNIKPRRRPKRLEE
jgi:hypothetical protein